MNAGDLCEMIESDSVDQVSAEGVLRFGPVIEKGEMLIILERFNPQTVIVLTTSGAGCVWLRRIKRIDP